MLITTDSHPNIIKAFNTIDQDNNGPRALSLPVCDVPVVWEKYLGRIEAAIGSLSRTERDDSLSELPPHVKPDMKFDSDFAVFCMGEDSDVRKLANRSLDLQLANELLNEYFEDFYLTKAEKPVDPYQRAIVSRIEYLEKEPTPEKSQEAAQLRYQLK